LRDLGLNEIPLPNQILKKPFLDISTKLEMSNRYITREEAEKLVNLGREEIGRIEKIVLLINELIFREVERVGRNIR